MKKSIKTLEQLEARKHWIKKEIQQQEERFVERYNRFTHPFKEVKEIFSKQETKKSPEKTEKNLNTVFNAVLVGVKMYSIIKTFSSKNKS